jgi:hypothetical protein
MPSLVDPVPLTLDRPRHLYLGNEALFTAERELSRLWGEHISLFTVLSGTMGINDLSVLLHQALLHEDPTLTLSQVQALMDFSKMSEIIFAVLAAWNLATAPAEPAAAQGDSDSPLASTSPGAPSGLLAVSN